jgi:hypothetical protein
LSDLLDQCFNLSSQERKYSGGLLKQNLKKERKRNQKKKNKERKKEMKRKAKSTIWFRIDAKWPEYPFSDLGLLTFFPKVLWDWLTSVQIVSCLGYISFHSN